MKRYIFLYLMSYLLCSGSFAQEIVTLEQCHNWAVVNAPTHAQISKYEQLADIKQKEAVWSYLPKFEINAQATYQDPVLKIETENHLMEQFFPEFPHDYYKFTFDLNMPIYDGGTTSNTKKYNRINSDLDLLNTEVTLFQLQEQINTIYLNIFFSEESLNILALHLENLNRDIAKVKASVENGTVLKSSLDILEAEKLKIEQQMVENHARRNYLIRMLSEYTGQDLSNATFVLPEVHVDMAEMATNRPEREMFSLQHEGLGYQKNLLRAQSLPKLNLFASGGYARSTYNMFDTDFGWQYMAGVSLKIPLINWFYTKVGQDYLSVQQEVIELQLDDYERNMRIQLLQKLSDIEKYTALIEQDKLIVEKRKSVIEATQTQLEEGVVTVNDYLKELNNQSEALFNQQLHKLQLLQAKIDFNALKGDLQINKNTN